MSLVTRDVTMTVTLDVIPRAVDGGGSATAQADKEADNTFLNFVRNCSDMLNTARSERIRAARVGSRPVNMGDVLSAKWEGLRTGNPEILGVPS